LSSREQELLMLARLWLAQGQPDEAERLLSPLASDAEADERTGALIEILALQACVRHAQGDRERAVTVLMKALALAEPEGFVRTFVDEGEVMQQLLTAVARQPATIADETSLPSKGYVARLLHAFNGQTSPDTPPQSPDKEAGLVEPLTARELEVLQLIAAGDSNRAVAKKLVITVSAVKKHTSNIYGKLNVNSRTQAVARARQLSLLPE
jgi:LuxR family maltose regulon positive regulatory protein